MSHESKTYNYREERFKETNLPFDQKQAHNNAAIATSPGIIKSTNDCVKLTTDNQLCVQLYDNQHTTGFYIDDLIALCKKFLQNMPQDEYRHYASRCLATALYLLDRRSVMKHGYFESPKEVKTPPSQEFVINIHELDQINKLCVKKTLEELNKSISK